MIGRIVPRIMLGLLFGLLLAEGIVRVYLDWMPARRASYLADPAAGYRLRPQGPDEDPTDQHVNSLGFRDREHPDPRPVGTWRVVGIGDSFVFGEVHLAENFLRVAETRLAAAAADGSIPAPPPASDPSARETSGAGPKRPGIDMVLMGLGGYSPENYLGVLRAHALPLKPNLVLLCFFVGNDVTGIPTRSRVRHGELYPVSSANRWLNLCRKSSLFSFSERYVFFRLRAARLRSLRATSSSEPSPARPPASSPLLVGFYNAVQSERLPIFLRLPSAGMESLWREAEGYLTQFDRSCRQAGVRWALVAIPDEIQVDPEVRSDVLTDLHHAPELYDFEQPERRLKDFASRRSVPYLDLLPALTAAHRQDARLYLPHDTHWSPRGNEVAGEAVATFVQGLLRPAPRPHPVHRPVEAPPVERD